VAKLLLSWTKGYVFILHCFEIRPFWSALGSESQYTQTRLFYRLFRQDLKPEYPTEGLWEGSELNLAYDKDHNVGQMSEKFPSKPRAMFSFVPPARVLFKVGPSILTQSAKHQECSSG
jgi:hypothetical protein